MYVGIIIKGKRSMLPFNDRLEADVHVVHVSGN